jgi:hypothetical protein
MPSKGEVCEAAVRKYLGETLGTRYSVTNGFAFDSEGNQSQELDVIVFDDYWATRLTPRDSDEPPYVPVESVYAVMEVKKTLSSSALRDAIDNIRSFKALSRPAVGPKYVTSNMLIEGLGSKTGKARNRDFAAIFALSAERSMEAVVEQLKADVTGLPPELWPDVVVVHKQGVILPLCVTCQSSGTRIDDVTGVGHQPSYLLDHLGADYSLLGFHFLLMHNLHFSILVPPNFNEMYRTLALAARLLASKGNQKT